MNWTNSAVAAERALRTGVRNDLAAWAGLALAPQGQVPARHHRLMIRELETVAGGGCDRLMLLPPGSAKSTYASLLFPAWFLARRPGAHVIAASHTAGLAQAFGRGVRGLLLEHRARLGGGGRSAEPGGAPVRDHGGRHVLRDRGARAGDGAAGGLGRDRRSGEGARGGGQPGASGCAVGLVPLGSADPAQAWGAGRFGDDAVASGRPGRAAAGGDGGVAGGAAAGLGGSGEAGAGDLLGRAPGEALWPEWEDAAALERKRLAMGDRAWAALFQQSPRLPGGRLFQVGRVAVTDVVLPGAAVRAWDLAASVGGDWTAGVRLARSAEGLFQVQDVVRFKGGPEEVVQAIRAAAERDGPGVAVGLPQDPGQAGRSQVAFLTARLAGWRVVSSPESGAKAVRAMPVASQVNAGTVSVLAGAWTGAFLAELEDFPGGACDDQVDALSRAFGMMVAAPAGAAGGARVARVDWGER